MLERFRPGQFRPQGRAALHDLRRYGRGRLRGRISGVNRHLPALGEQTETGRQADDAGDDDTRFVCMPGGSASAPFPRKPEQFTAETVGGGLLRRRQAAGKRPARLGRQPRDQWMKGMK